ncbi:HDIG domain-containing protein [Aliiglaciecola sp. 3_MG-2023]|uniref:HDIG domain-containing metalloprotein n=1 Tax=Aliiglaciecola sp. 3_MG-2023 TaxID=3062644 RepID=UPI0026E19609|nr:HDIG domain-containing metalloprotein [Aliiglaciecola sp. 3_MG-2023]MDO6693906.1 HDIG domain-containing protein [Aliiglaciecola sp. 3_MG-2023]
MSDIPAKTRRVSLIPYSAAINANDLTQLIDCVANIDFSPLRQFIERVLLQSKVMVPFVRNPASLRFHHNSLGGLLSHSFAVVNLITKEFTRGTIECDIVKAAALLHDIGKTQTLSDNLSRTAIGSLADHDALTLEICAEPLASLSREHPHIANQLRHAWTCASPNARYGFKAKTRVARQLRRADNQNAKTGNSAFIKQIDKLNMSSM